MRQIIMMNKQRFSGPRCSSCGRPFQPRQMRDGNWSQTCGQTACVSMYSRKKSNNTSSYNSSNYGVYRKPQNAQ